MSLPHDDDLVPGLLVWIAYVHVRQSRPAIITDMDRSSDGRVVMLYVRDETDGFIRAALRSGDSFDGVRYFRSGVGWILDGWVIAFERPDDLSISERPLLPD